MYTGSYLKDEEIGGVELLCNNFRITVENTLRERANLCYEENLPLIRNYLQPTNSS